ncbi:MAG: hypothetical protein EBY57_03905, partial [Actinobacteria bacterium]|nr:hypothetical protein [Actinomycetota bacterium]
MTAAVYSEMMRGSKFRSRVGLVFTALLLSACWDFGGDPTIKFGIPNPRAWPCVQKLNVERVDEG